MGRITQGSHTPVAGDVNSPISAGQRLAPRRKARSQVRGLGSAARGCPRGRPGSRGALESSKAARRGWPEEGPGHRQAEREKPRAG